MRNKLYVLCAAFGGVFSNLCTVAVGMQKSPPEFPNSTFWIGFCIWAGVGALVGAIFQEKNLKKAFFVGIGLPALIQVNVANITSSKSSAPAKTDGAFLHWILPAAYAQSTDSISSKPRLVKITMDKMSGISNKELRVIFSSGNGRKESLPWPDGFTETVLATPGYADQIAIEFRGIQSAPIHFPAGSGDTAVTEVSIQENPWSGFWQSMGVQKGKRYTVAISLKK